jgi:hypothetical protein
MKYIAYAGIMLMLAGCGPALYQGRPADPIPGGWYSQEKTGPQRSQDLSECRTLCRTA